WAPRVTGSSWSTGEGGPSTTTTSSGSATPSPGEIAGLVDVAEPCRLQALELDVRQGGDHAVHGPFSGVEVRSRSAARGRVQRLLTSDHDRHGTQRVAGTGKGPHDGTDAVR